MGELRYNGDCPDWDNEGYEAYQTYVSDRLDKIIEKYEEDERFVNYYEFIELQQKIDQEYGFGKWIPVKTDKNIYFKIDKIDPGTNKVIITFWAAEQGAVGHGQGPAQSGCWVNAGAAASAGWSLAAALLPLAASCWPPTVRPTHVKSCTDCPASHLCPT